LGTVQMGLPYGINNLSGKPDQTEVTKILNKAANEGIHLLDSAEAYGDSLHVIGAYLQKNENLPFRVISKFIGNGEPLQAKIDRTLTVLGHDSLHAYMYHRFTDYRSGQFKKELRDLKASGKIKATGISLYSLQEFGICLDDPDIDIIQVPFNPLDASQKKLDLMERAKGAGKEIHVRSVFLQGLFFKPAHELTGNLKEFSDTLQELENISRHHSVSIREICLNFALHQPDIDHVVIGVERLNQLQENIQAVNEGIPDQLLNRLKSIPNVSEPLLNPSTWKP
jgi:aryl-alcohol dehydrogenase-like predicted oxidoreductase